MKSLLSRLGNLIILVLLASGCAVGPDFVQPDAPSQEEWIDSGLPQMKTEPADLTAWWKIFNDPVLDSLIETAYRQNLPLQIAGDPMQLPSSSIFSWGVSFARGMARRC